MKRRLSNIMFGMLALLFVLASPVFAEKDPFKQMGKGVPMTNMKIQKLDGKNLSMPGKQFKSGTLFSTPPTDIGVFNQKSYSLKDVMRFSNYSNLMESKKFFKMVGTPNMIEKVNLDYEPIVPPINEVWDNTYVDKYTTIDANGDNVSWGINTKINYAYYVYSLANDADDWLLSPYIQLEAGEMYIFEVLLSCLIEQYPERIEILYGQGDDPTLYSDYALQATDVTNTSPKSYLASIVPNKSGVYRIAFHAISDANQFQLSINGWSLNGPVAVTVPGAATDVQVAPAALGALNAVVAFTAPSLNFAGDPLQSITKIDVLNGEEVLATIENPVPGSEQSATVFVNESGTYNFKIIAYNEDGEGLAAFASAYIGLDCPTTVENVRAIDNKDGTITLYWDKYKNEKGVNGGYVDLSAVFYNVHDLSENGYISSYPIISTSDTTCTISYPEWNQGDFKFKNLLVAPAVNNFVGQYNFCYIIVGQPEMLQYIESFPARKTSHSIWYNTINYNTWTLFTTSVDGDDGCAGFIAGTHGAAGSLNTAKISLKDTKAPYLMFNYLFGLGDYGSDLEFYVYIDLQDGNGLIPIFYKNGEDSKTEDWLDAIVDLSDFINEEYVIISFLAKGKYTQSMVLLDNILIKDMAIPDLSVKINAPSKAVVGQEIDVEATVDKNSFVDALPGDYSVVFYVNDEPYETVEGTNSIEGVIGHASYSIKYIPSIFDEENGVTFKAEVVYDGDLDTSNNVDKTHMDVTVPNLPRITDLAATKSDNEETLTWSAPEESSIYPVVIEDFENGDGGFTAADSDGDGYNWTMVNSTSFKTHSGKGCWISNSNINNVSALTPDNWLITPEVKLVDEFSFYACGQDDENCEEVFAIYVSTEGKNDVSKFVKVGENITVTAEMTKYTVDLSQFGGKTGHVAIRHYNSSGMSILNVDDVAYVPAGAEMLKHTGYRVYRNGELVAELPVGTNEYVDEYNKNGIISYHVTNIYSGLESGLSNEAQVEVLLLMGDVNHDGVVDVSDINAVVRYILGNTPDVFYPDNGLMDDDDVIGVNDIPYIVSIILGTFSDGEGLLTNYGEKAWTWDTEFRTDGSAWGNMGYAPGDGNSFVNDLYGIWWGCHPADLVGQLSHSDTGVATGEESVDAYMTFNHYSGIVKSFDGNGKLIRSGKFQLEGFKNYRAYASVDGSQTEWAYGYLNTDPGVILWPFQVNSHMDKHDDTTCPTRFEVMQLDDEHLKLIYPQTGTGCWEEATWWAFKKK